MIDQVRTLDLPGNRVLRIGAYEHDPGDGDPPERRVFVAAGWASSPPLPFHEQTVDLPAAVLPALLDALRAVMEVTP